jgi:FlaG/FlaF family flagellin (archaellin)
MMIAVAIAGALLVYAWVMGYLSFSSERAGEEIMIPSIGNDPADTDLLVYVENVGGVVVQLEEDECLYVNGILVPCTISGVTVSNNMATLNGGETATLRYVGGAALPGEKVKIKVTTLRGTSAEKSAYPAGNVSPEPESALGHFEFAYIPSPQTSGTAFSITIRATDENGARFTGYSGVNNLTYSGWRISPSTTGSFSDGVWTGNVTLAGSASDATITTVAQSNSSWTGTSNTFVALAEEPPVTMWNQTYGETAYDMAYSLVATSDGGYAIAGRTYSFGAGMDDFWLVKTDVSGNMEWNRTYGGPNIDIAFSMVATSDGGYALAGYTGSFGAGAEDFWLVKTDAYGNMEWNQTYGGTGDDTARFLIATLDGGYAIVGSTSSFGAGDRDFWLVKTD